MRLDFGFDKGENELSDVGILMTSADGDGFGTDGAGASGGARNAEGRRLRQRRGQGQEGEPRPDQEMDARSPTRSCSEFRFS